MTNATRIALAGASLMTLAACSSPDPVAVTISGNEANLAINDMMGVDSGNTAENGSVASAADTRSVPMSKPDQSNTPQPASKSAPPRPEPQLSPREPEAEVDPVREDVDTTDPG